LAPHWEAVANSISPSPPKHSNSTAASSTPAEINKKRRFIGKTAGQFSILIGNSTLRRLFRATDSQKL
jgi:hypothetical protein